MYAMSAWSVINLSCIPVDILAMSRSFFTNPQAFSLDNGMCMLICSSAVKPKVKDTPEWGTHTNAVKSHDIMDNTWPQGGTHALKKGCKSTPGTKGISYDYHVY